MTTHTWVVRGLDPEQPARPSPDGVVRKLLRGDLRLSESRAHRTHARWLRSSRPGAWGLRRLRCRGTEMILVCHSGRAAARQPREPHAGSWQRAAQSREDTARAIARSTGLSFFRRAPRATRRSGEKGTKGREQIAALAAPVRRLAGLIACRAGPRPAVRRVQPGLQCRVEEAARRGPQALGARGWFSRRTVSGAAGATRRSTKSAREPAARDRRRLARGPLLQLGWAARSPPCARRSDALCARCARR